MGVDWNDAGDAGRRPAAPVRRVEDPLLRPATPVAAPKVDGSGAVPDRGDAGIEIHDYDDLITELERRVKDHRSLNEEDLRKLRRRQAANRIVAGIGDMGRAIANMWATSEYAPNAYSHAANGLSGRMQERYDRYLKEREAADKVHLNRMMSLAGLKAKKREAEAQAKERAEMAAWNRKLREWKEEEHENEVEDRPLEIRKKEAEVEYYEQRAILENVRAGMEPELIKAKIEKMKNGSRKGGTTRDGRKYYGTLAGVAYATKADYEKALNELCRAYGVPTHKEINTFFGPKETRIPTGERAAAVEEKTRGKGGKKPAGI